MAKRGPLKIILLPTAKTDLMEIVNFIAKDSLKYAKLEKILIIKRIELLKSFPESGKPYEYKSIKVCQIVFRNYLIFYRLKSDSIIEIIAVHHHSRLISNNPAFKEDE